MEPEHTQSPHRGLSPTSPWGVPTITTDWRKIRAAAGGSEDRPDAESWEWLAARYHSAIQHAIETKLRGHPAAQDAVEDFLHYLWENSLLQKVDRGEGRFRQYLQAVIDKFVKARRRAADAQARRQGSPVRETDATTSCSAEEYEEMLEARWADEILARVLTDLLESSPSDADVMLRRFGLPRPGEAGPFVEASSEEVAAATGKKVNAVYAAMHRAQNRVRTRLIARLELEARSLGVTSDELIQRLREAHPGLF